VVKTAETTQRTTKEINGIKTKDESNTKSQAHQWQ